MNEKSLHQQRSDLEHAEDWHHWTKNAPKLKFQSNWQVQIVPPWGGAMARMIIWDGDCKVSVFWDTIGRLGCMESPYYEIHPCRKGEDIERFLVNECDEMMHAIHLSLQNQKYPSLLELGLRETYGILVEWPDEIG